MHRTGAGCAGAGRVSGAATAARVAIATAAAAQAVLAETHAELVGIAGTGARAAILCALRARLAGQPARALLQVAPEAVTCGQDMCRNTQKGSQAPLLGLLRMLPRRRGQDMTASLRLDWDKQKQRSCTEQGVRVVTTSEACGGELGIQCQSKQWPPHKTI